MNASVHLLRHVLPSVVEMKARIPDNHPSVPILGSERMGTGTFVDPGGLVLTVNYVIIGASSIEVTLFDGQVVTGTVVASDFASGIALVKIPGGSCRTAAVRPSTELQTGEDVFLMGSVGNGGPRVSTGAISYLGPFDAYWEYSLDRAIRSTVMSPGVGGGPMFDTRGRLVGVVSLNLSEVGRLSMAVPIENFLDHRDELLTHGRLPTSSGRAWVGVYSHTIQEHVVILGVLPGGPAGRCGIRAGDVVLAVDGKPIRDRPGLYRQLWSRRSGDIIVFQIFRSNEVRTVEVDTTSVEEMFA